MRRVEHEIRREAKRLIVSVEQRFRLHAEERKRIEKRSTAPHQLRPVERPSWWGVDQGFNPYRTRARAKQIGHGVQAALVDLSYRPRNPVERDIEKPGGGTRSVCVYQVADSAVSKMVYESLLRKNLPLMSARSYAYRKDLSVQDAIRYIRSALQDRARIYVAEYDFSHYFDAIDHGYLLETLSRNFFVSAVERQVIRGFIEATPHAENRYQPVGGPTRTIGIPQGTSISLFLANAAAWKLDRALEDHGVGFVRYADDTLIWSTDYGRITAAAELLQIHASAMRVPVSLKKSEGVRLLVAPESRNEMRRTHFVDYLGYRIRLSSISLKPANEQKIRTKVQQLIYHTLLREPLNGTQYLGRLGVNLDRDYAVIITRLRRYLYGDLSEREVRKYGASGTPLRRFKGVMAAFPLLDDTTELEALDDWILNCLWLAVRKRGGLLIAAGAADLPKPHGLSRGELRVLRVRSTRTGEVVDLRAPSVRRIARVLDLSKSRMF
jgi:RNA-directed DNA polymerase